MSDTKPQRSASGSTAVSQSLPFAPHTVSSAKLVEWLHTDPALGLAEDEVRRRLDVHGPNRLKPPAKPSVLKIVVRQIGNAMSLVLIAAMAVSFGTMDWISGGVIAALVVLNVTVGAVTEWQAEKTVASLESVGAPQATVLRHSGSSKSTTTIPVEDVVPGDVILLKNGDVVPADARILEGQISNLECDEAFLTGESLPVAKQEEKIEEEGCPVGDRINLVFSGSQVTKGRARAVVFSTGMSTEIGKIATALQSKATKTHSGWRARWHRTKVVLGVADTTPLQIKLNKLAYILLAAACLTAIIVVASTGFSNVPLSVATYAVAAAVSVLPASLVAVVSLTLARASTDLAKRNALVRRMDAIEALAGVENVCSDKTGTLTVGRMVVRKFWVPRADWRVPEEDEEEAEGKEGEGQNAEGDTKMGQAYEFETGADPFYPRGQVTALSAPLEQRKGQDEAELDESDDGPRVPKIRIDQPAGGSGGGKRKPVRGRTQDEQDEVDEQDAVVSPHSMEGGLRDLALCASLCNQATLNRPKEEDIQTGNGQWEANGDPTEVALQVAAHKLGVGKPFLTHSKSPNALAKVSSARSAHAHAAKEHKPVVVGLGGHFEQIVEHPFDSSVKRMSIAYRFVPDPKFAAGGPGAAGAMAMGDKAEEGYILCLLKGAVERVFERCVSVHDTELTKEKEADVIRQMDALAAQGLRVLALCGKKVPLTEEETIRHMPRDEFEQGFGFLGLAGIFDPPRKESAGAVADCIRAGITPRMLTGDHPATATAIALSIGILKRDYPKGAVMTGQEFDALSDAQVDALGSLPLVVARCAPETKVRMVDAIHRRGEHTVMTGDGVNDAPSLKRADVGVGMGTGSDVAKQSANLVLADDNFATICRAIRKGRSVFRNLGKFLLYLLSGNLAECIVLLVGLAFKDENGQSVFPLSPVAALWINTLTAGPPALALGLEPTASDAMDLPPSEFRQIFTLEFWADLVFYGVLMGALALVNFVIVLWGYSGGDLGSSCNNEGDNPRCSAVFEARATCFATLVIILMIHALECKHFSRGIFQVNLRDNKVLLWCVVVLTLLTFPVVYIPRINDDVFFISNIGWSWGIVFGMIFVYLGATELYKYVKRVILRKKYHYNVKADWEAEQDGEKMLRMEKTIAPV